MTVFINTLFVATVVSVFAGCSTPISKPSGESTPSAPLAPPPAASTTLASLAGTSWALSRLNDHAVVPPAGARRPFIAFDQDGRLSGFTGVNRIGGHPAVQGDLIDFGRLSATRMAGPAELASLENDFLDGLRRTNAWHTDGPRLVLLEGKTVVAVFDPIQTASDE